MLLLNIKAMVVVLTITAIAFLLTKGLFLKFMREEDFARRRNIWFIVTAAQFLSPNFWLYTVVAGFAIYLAAKKDSNKGALYLCLILAAPPIRAQVPTFGIVNNLLALDHLRVLSLVILLPMLFQSQISFESDASTQKESGFAKVPGYFLTIYILYLCTLAAPYQSATAELRYGLELGIDYLIPYFGLYKCLKSRDSIIEAMLAFVMGLVAVAPLAAFEFFKHWLLYTDLQYKWNVPFELKYLLRGDQLRAMAAAGHSIVLGFVMAVGIGFWLYLWTRLKSAGWRWSIMITLTLGLVFTLARGPWVGAIAILLLHSLLGPKALTRTAKGFGITSLVLIPVLLSPYGATFIDHLPFIGNVDAGTIDYRKRLAEVSWELVRQYPFFGTFDFMARMEEMRQGEGIIDFVNIYAGIAVSSGLVGLGIYVMFFATIILRLFKALRTFRQFDQDAAAISTCLLATLIGALLMMATTSDYLSVPITYLCIAAMSNSIANIARETYLKYQHELRTSGILVLE